MIFFVYAFGVFEGDTHSSGKEGWDNLARCLFLSYGSRHPKLFTVITIRFVEEAVWENQSVIPSQGCSSVIIVVVLREVCA